MRCELGRSGSNEPQERIRERFAVRGGLGEAEGRPTGVFQSIHDGAGTVARAFFASQGSAAPMQGRFFAIWRSRVPEVGF